MDINAGIGLNLQQREYKQFFVLCSIFLLGIVFFSSSFLHGAQVDPFYEKLVAEGEKAFIERNYEEAVKTLEVASFGLHQDKKLLGKAYAYLGLSYYHLKNDEKSKDYLIKAVNLSGDENINSLGLSAGVLNELSDILSSFNIKKGVKPAKASRIITLTRTPSKTSEEKVPKKTQERVPKPKLPLKKPLKKAGRESASAEVLKARVEAEPHNVSLYYQLYDIYRHDRNVKAAVAILEKLVTNNPHELNAFYILAKIEFSLKNYRDALENFNKVVSPADEAKVESDLLIRSMIFISSCLLHLKQKEHLRSFVKVVEDSTSTSQLNRILSEEGMVKEWNKIKRSLR